MSKFKLFSKRHHFSHSKTPLQPAQLPSSPEQHPPLPNCPNKTSHPYANLTTSHDTLTNKNVTSNTDTPIKVYSCVSCPFPPPSCLTPFQSACPLSS